MCNNLCDSNKDKINYVNIIDSIVKQGTFDKSIFTKTSDGLIHTIHNGS